MGSDDGETPMFHRTMTDIVKTKKSTARVRRRQFWGDCESERGKRLSSDSSYNWQVVVSDVSSLMIDLDLDLDISIIYTYYKYIKLYL